MALTCDSVRKYHTQRGGAIMTVTLDMSVTHTTTPCATNPDRWADGGDDPALKALCRSCPRRWLCAKEALHTPAVEGMIAGVHVPKEGRTRAFALRPLQSLAAQARDPLAHCGPVSSWTVPAPTEPSPV
jgi:WhiB family transcriptional regulator, redox-sensing transcriptional regulator